MSSKVVREQEKPVRVEAEDLVLSISPLLALSPSRSFGHHPTLRKVAVPQRRFLHYSVIKASPKVL